MTEINKNMNVSKIQKTEVKKEEQIEKTSPAFEKEEAKIVQDFSNPSEILGRSQVTKSDNLKEDVSFGVSNAKTIEQSDKLFELAYNNLKEQGDPNAYEKACTIATCDDAKTLL